MLPVAFSLRIHWLPIASLTFAVNQKNCDASMLSSLQADCQVRNTKTVISLASLDDRTGLPENTPDTFAEPGYTRIEPVLGKRWRPGSVALLGVENIGDFYWTDWTDKLSHVYYPNLPRIR